MTSETYPDALGRLWSALELPARRATCWSRRAPGFEFVDWGGADHVGGGSHGSLHRDDSEGVLLLCGVDAPEREQWSLDGRDAAGARALRCTLGRVTTRRGAVAERPHAVHLRVRAGLRKPHNWVQLVKFCAVGALGLRGQPVRVRASAWRRSDLHHLVAATAAFVVAVIEQLLVEPPLDVPRPRRPRRLPGRALLHGQRRRRSCSPRPCSSCS